MKKHKRRTIEMHKAVQEKTKLIKQRIHKILDELSNQDHPITFSNIAKLGGVSKAWLYRHSEVRERIDRLRISKNNFLLSSQILPETKHITISALRDRIKKLELENNQLRKQLEIIYGELHSKRK